MMLLAALLAFTLLAGSLIMISLQNGLKSYEARLGADVVVVPGEARSKGEFESILLQGIPGYFYMNQNVMEKIRGMEGVEVVSPQFFLASAKASCCSVRIQLIGFEPETDFTVQPWIRESYSGEVGFGDILIGSKVTMPSNGILTFYEQDLHVVGQLEETGTGLDTCVFGSLETMRDLIVKAEELGFRYLGKISAEQAISTVMVKVQEGYDIESVCNDINIHVRKVEAGQSRNMVSSIASGLTSVSHIISGLMVMIWVLAVGVLALSFVLIANERKKEFAILRVMGASKKMLSESFLTESALISAIGGAAGAIFAALAAIPFTSLIRSRLNLPYLMPGAGVIAGLMLAAVILSVLTGALSAAVSSGKVSRTDAGLVLREGA
ncbi:MAG: ABC transporter permease [Oscillospiraceae bacterium]|nr:ABC transporter permease [Oscillospiraceae bacterium]